MRIKSKQEKFFSLYFIFQIYKYYCKDNIFSRACFVAVMQHFIYFFDLIKLKEAFSFTFINKYVIIINKLQKKMTPEAERFNGWAAMLGFVAAVGAYVTTGQIIPGWF